MASRWAKCVDIDLATVSIDEGTKGEHLSIAHLVDESFDQAAMEPTDEGRVGFGQVTERAMHEPDREAIVAIGHLGIEPKARQLTE